MAIGGLRVVAYRCFRSWLDILLLGWACTATIAGVLIVGHDRFPTYDGPEFVSRALDQWAYLHQVTLDFSRPGKPTDNAVVESFNGRLRDECLNAHWFLSLADARSKIEAWRRHFNESRPHTALGWLTPMEFALLAAEKAAK